MVLSELRPHDEHRPSYIVHRHTSTATNTSAAVTTNRTHGAQLGA